jgi:hypothetical protein
VFLKSFKRCSFNVFFFQSIFSLCRVDRHRKTIIQRNQHRDNIPEAVQVGAVKLSEEEEAEGMGLTVAVDGVSVLREALVPMKHL